MSVFADVPPSGTPPAHFTVVALPSTSYPLIYFGVELFGLIIVNDAVLPTGIPARPVKLTVLFADEFAVKTTSGADILMVVLAPIKVVTFADSRTVLRKLVAPPVPTLDSVMVDAILSPVIVAAAIKLLVIAVSPILSPVIVAAAIKLLVIAVKPILSPVIVVAVIASDEIFESAIFLLFY